MPRGAERTLKKKFRLPLHKNGIYLFLDYYSCFSSPSGYILIKLYTVVEWFFFHDYHLKISIIFQNGFQLIVFVLLGKLFSSSAFYKPVLKLYLWNWTTSMFLLQKSLKWFLKVFIWTKKWTKIFLYFCPSL